MRARVLASNSYETGGFSKENTHFRYHGSLFAQSLFGWEARLSSFILNPVGLEGSDILGGIGRTKLQALCQESSRDVCEQQLMSI